MIFVGPTILGRIGDKSLSGNGFRFIESLSLFNPLELKKSPRSPRPGSPGSNSQLSSALSETARNKMEKSESLLISEFHSNCLSRGNNSGQSGIPRTFPEFRNTPRTMAVNRKKRVLKVLQPVQVNDLYMVASNAFVKILETCGGNSPLRKGTKKAPNLSDVANAEVFDGFLQSFKSCRGHHLKFGPRFHVLPINTSVSGVFNTSSTGASYSSFPSTLAPFQDSKRQRKAPKKSPL
jgi:hypothetical protein